MKKVTGSFYSHPNGSFQFEYYVPDDMTSEKIEKIIVKRTGTETCFYEAVKKVTGSFYSHPNGSFQFEHYTPIEKFIMKKTGTETCFDAEEDHKIISNKNNH